MLDNISVTVDWHVVSVGVYLSVYLGARLYCLIIRRHSGSGYQWNYRPDRKWWWGRCGRCKQVIVAVTVRHQCRVWPSLQYQLNDAIVSRLMRSIAAAVRRPVSRQLVAINHHNWHSTTTGTFAIFIATHRSVVCPWWFDSATTTSSLSQQFVYQQRVSWPIVGCMSTVWCNGQWLCSAVIDTSSLSSCRCIIGKYNIIFVVIIRIAVWRFVTPSVHCATHCQLRCRSVLSRCCTCRSLVSVALVIFISERFQCSISVWNKLPATVTVVECCLWNTVVVSYVFICFCAHSGRFGYDATYSVLCQPTFSRSLNTVVAYLLKAIKHVFIIWCWQSDAMKVAFPPGNIHVENVKRSLTLRDTVDWAVDVTKR